MIPQKKYAIAICLCYLCLVPVAAYFAYKMLGNTRMVYKAPGDSIVGKAETFAKEYFTTQVLHNPLYMLVTQNNETQSIVNPKFESFSFALAEQCVKPVNQGGWQGDVISIEGYFLEKFTQIKTQLIGGAFNQSSLITIDAMGQVGNDFMSDFTKDVKEFVNNWIATNNGSFSLAYTSVESIVGDLQQGIAGDLLKIDSVTIPIAMAALAYCLRSIRMLLMPAIAFPSIICLAFGFLYPVSRATSLSSLAPELSAACMMAISFDYCLFILTRFKEQVAVREVTLGISPETEWIVVKSTTVLCAHNILVSGLTIAAALGALAFIPVSFVHTIGIAFSIGCICAVFVSMTLLPALLLVMYDFFKQSTECTALWNCLKSKKNTSSDEEAGEKEPLVGGQQNNITSPSQKKLSNMEEDMASNTATVDRGSAVASLDAADSGMQVNGKPHQAGGYTALRSQDDEHMLSPVEQHENSERRKQYASWWYKVGNLSFRHPILISIGVCLVGIPFFYLSSRLLVDFDLYHQVPRSSPHAATLREIVATIGHGSNMPFYIVIKANETGGIMRSEVFDLVNDLTFQICEAAGQPLDRVMSFAYANQTRLKKWEAEAAYALNLDGYQYLFNRTVDGSRTVAMIALYTLFDPFSAIANTYLDNVNKAIKHFDSRGYFETGFTGASADSWAIMQKVMSLFPIQIILTFLVIFVFIAIVFRSAFIPIRMVLTVAYTVAAAFGFGVIAFQYSWLHGIWTALEGVKSYTWVVPIFSFPLLCALALDYDVFLLTRILEFKKLGFNDEAAMSKAVWKTGRIISFAGVIMAISFGSLMLSNTTMLNQFGLITCFAVLIDTFVIRTFFVPALMSIAPSFSWWPRKFEAKLTLDDMKETFE